LEWSVFDRVVSLRFERDTPIARVDLTAFKKLERVAKPAGFKPSPKLRNTPLASKEYATRYKAEFDAHMSRVANAELKYAIPESQIAKLGHNSFVWWAELKTR